MIDIALCIGVNMKNPRLINLSGKRFGKWEVIEKSGNTKGGAAIWKCRCECGNIGFPIGTDLRQGKTTNCGCDARKKVSKMMTTHGRSGSRIHRIWKGMLSRCYSPTGSYRIKGVYVCDEWRNSYEEFEEWAVKNGYGNGLSIDRISNDDGYHPDNCRWTDRETQSQNRKFVRLSPSGEPWYKVAEKNGIRSQLFHGRIHDGWTDEEAATIPKGGRRVIIK